eukprot:CAMPEP_0180400862 /NCGR_PEP_ID=MMETSP0989-20121125/37980_1 /TAXON_ID=697907 /ORGANISM="non described non described, Strain CCMP2293" /LENGTH=65 /DNA_ID=CAMNT_0022403783 /DNA_START=874 /DNA_END=1068 /DNA_ORIENTATION=+
MKRASRQRAPGGGQRLDQHYLDFGLEVGEPADNVGCQEVVQLSRELHGYRAAADDDKRQEGFGFL